MRRARLTFEVTVHIDEDNPSWKDQDLSIFSIAQEVRLSGLGVCPITTAVEVVKVKNTACTYLTDPPEGKKSSE